MTNLLYFSAYIKPIGKKMRFPFIVCQRFFIILFRRNKRIKLLHLDYSKKYLFNNSYLLIRYGFKNALWYNFKNLKKTTEKKPVVFNLKNLDTNDIVLIVYGFFEKKTFQINVRLEKTFRSGSFRIIISSLNKHPIFAPPIKVDRKYTLINIPKVNVSKTKIEITPSTYNQNDFI